MENMQQRHNHHSSAGLGGIDLAIWSVLVLLAMAAAYHPYYFGDEISPLRDAALSQGFLDALKEISAYKPRLVFNAVWALGGLHDWPRWWFGLVNAGGIIVIGACCAHIAGRWLGASRLQLWLLLGVIALSRFSAMVYFDYVSGIIETASLGLFLATVLAAYRAWAQPTAPWAALAVALATSAVLVHERYMAATFALGCAAAAAGWLEPAQWRRHRALLALGIALVPVATFLGLVKWLGSLPVSTGTSGQEVVLDLGTVKVFFMYLGNIFLGFNFGKDWFVGTLNMGSPAGLRLALAAGVVFAAGWAGFAMSLRRDRRALRAAIALLMLIGALMVMASLPGEGRQEARWMYPVGVLAALLVFCSSHAGVRHFLLGAMLLLSAIHWGSGALDATANVYVSRTAAYLGDGVNGLVPPGRKAVLVGLGDNPWEVGGRAGVDEFARRNFEVPMEVRIFEGNQPALADWADLGIIRSVGDNRFASRFAVVQGASLQALLEPGSIPADASLKGSGTTLGGAQEGWEDWKWSVPPQRRNGGIVLESVSTVAGFVEQSAAALDGRTLVYRAALSDRGDGTARMRLQVNWMGAEGKFLDASIEVVDVQADARDFQMHLKAPAGAVHGLVYANLHDGEARAVVLESVSVQSESGLRLGRGNDWPDWRWQGASEIGPDGIRLGSGATEAGFRETDAALLDNRLLIYRARLADPQKPSSMRLQINWLDRSQRFLGASIEVVAVQGESRNHPMLVVAPAGAAKGLVYANLHGPGEGVVVLESIDVKDLR